MLSVRGHCTRSIIIRAIKPEFSPPTIVQRLADGSALTIATHTDTRDIFTGTWVAAVMVLLLHIFDISNSDVTCPRFANSTAASLTLHISECLSSPIDFRWKKKKKQMHNDIFVTSQHCYRLAFVHKPSLRWASFAFVHYVIAWALMRVPQ